jgi:NAD+ kinase
MNTFQIVNRDDFESQKIEKNYKEILQNHGWKLTDQPELVISIGGDGTMLKAYQEFYSESTSFVGIHTGTLGFYADWVHEESDKLLDNILSSEPEIEQFPLVQVEFEFNSGEKKTFLALNEAVIKSKSISTFVIEVYIEEERFESFRGDGLVISSPSGSTAYNHSVGGSILHPSFESIQVAELASINNKEHRTLNRSFILPKHEILDLYIKNSHRDILVGIDGTDYSFHGIRRMRCLVANEKISFARYKPFPFWKRVKEKFLS